MKCHDLHLIVSFFILIRYVFISHIFFISQLNDRSIFKQSLGGLCNIIAEGFHFMPFGLVRLRTFRLSAWVT